MDNPDSPKSQKVVVFRWGAWPQRPALPEPDPVPPPVEAVRELTEQQVVVMRHIVDGKTNTEISKELGLNHGTIKFHVKNALKRLGCSSRKEAAVRFLSQR